MPKSTRYNAKIQIPNALVWVQCIAFVVLYGFWILPEIVGFRNTALVVGALAGLYPICQCRAYLIKKTAIPLWLMVGLFFWATFHLLFFSQEYPLQLLEFHRIWKYAALGGIFALGLGISLANASMDAKLKNQQSPFWSVIYFGLCLPVLTYLLKYVLTTYGANLGLQVPDYLKIYFGSQPYYVPKTDYVAFCLPVLAISLGQIRALLITRSGLVVRDCWAIAIYLTIIVATFFMFFIQDIKNGMVYAALCVLLFGVLLVFGRSKEKLGRNAFFGLIGIAMLVTALYPHIQKNHSWSTLIADTKVAFQLDKYQQWKYAGAQGYPNNEYGEVVSITNYERAAWFKVGLQLAAQTPMGYGLVEDSFKKMTKARWPEASSNLSHSHSGWLDVVLALGFPGFFCILGALVLVMRQGKRGQDPWGQLVFWALLANLILWITTEVSATVTFAVLIFWICWACGLTLMTNNQTKEMQSKEV